MLRVSILVLVECSYLLLKHETSCRHIWFQSLFWWNVVTYMRLVRGLCQAGSVSILVLVECSYLLDDAAPEQIVLVAFQSLFWWNVVTYTGRCISSGDVTPLFQSLFWWNVVTY